VTIYGVELVLYLLLAIAITVVMRVLERAGARRLGRTPSKRERRRDKILETAGL
jgi:polar amino acid transport system permease protein